MEEKQLTAGQKYRQSDKGKTARNRAMKVHRQKVRKILIDLLGGPVCVNCGFSNISAIQIDHINSGCVNETKQLGGSLKMMKFHLKNPEEAKKQLQILCANCNWIKRFENDENPKNF
jgi:hypothetical protein